MSSHQWIFISYRRAGGGRPLTSRIQTELETHLGVGSVFLDTTSIAAGAEWMRVLDKHLGMCLVLFVIVTPDWSVFQLSHQDAWVLRHEIRESIRLGKLIVPLFMDGASVPAASALPEDIREFASRQGYFVDSRSDGLFRAAIQVISQDVAKRYPATLIWQRPGVSWRQGIQCNSWRVEVDGSSLVELNGSDTSGTCKVPAGTRTLMVKWLEREYNRSWGQSTSFGYNSSGETSALRIDLRPGTYTLTLRQQPPTSKRNWFLRFVDGVLATDSHPRSIEVLSFSAATQVDQIKNLS
jgi:hypothetical protein